MKFTIDEMLKRLPLPADEKWVEGVWDIEPFRKGDTKLVFFAPRHKDYQTSHDEDEFYIIARGNGELFIEEEKFTCEVGDVFFVPGKIKHYFKNFTVDFAAWAIFF